jgi:DNA-binding NtrC family response regulator
MAVREGTRQRPIVLLADDDEDIRVVFEMVLSERYDVRGAESAKAALALAAQIEPDVLLLDWTLPDADGDQVIARLREQGKPLAAIPVVIVSGASTVHALARQFGVLACPKPCDADQLISAVEQALASRNGSR